MSSQLSLCRSSAWTCRCVLAELMQTRELHELTSFWRKQQKKPKPILPTCDSVSQGNHPRPSNLIAQSLEGRTWDWCRTTGGWGESCDSSSEGGWQHQSSAGSGASSLWREIHDPFPFLSVGESVPPLEGIRTPERRQQEQTCQTLHPHGQSLFPSPAHSADAESDSGFSIFAAPSSSSWLWEHQVVPRLQMGSEKKKHFLAGNTRSWLWEAGTARRDSLHLPCEPRSCLRAAGSGSDARGADAPRRLLRLWQRGDRAGVSRALGMDPCRSREWLHPKPRS